MTQIKKVKKNKLFFEYSYAINGELRLSFRELEVFSILLEYLWRVKYEGLPELSSMAMRKYIMDNTAINRHNLSKYMFKFERFGIVHRDGVGKPYRIKNDLLPEVIDNSISLKYIISCE